MSAKRKKDEARNSEENGRGKKRGCAKQGKRGKEEKVWVGGLNMVHVNEASRSELLRCPEDDCETMRLKRQTYPDFDRTSTNTRK